MKKLALFMVLIMGMFVVSAQNTQRTPIKVADLQKSITDNITKDYPGFAIKEATKVLNNGLASYEVIINKGTTSETLLYDSSGKFLRKEGMTSGMKEKPKENMGHMAHKTTPKKK